MATETPETRTLTFQGRFVFSTGCVDCVFIHLGNGLMIHVNADWLGTTTALYEWADSYDAKVGQPFCALGFAPTWSARGKRRIRSALWSNEP